MSQLPLPPPRRSRFKKVLTKVFYPYGKRTGGMELLKWDLKQAPRGIVRSAIAPGSDLFETGSEKRVREFRYLIAHGYSAANALQMSGVTVEDIEAARRPRRLARTRRLPSSARPAPKRTR